MTARLALENVAIGYGRKVLAEGIDLALTPGRVVALLGPNGVGKTTLLRTMLGLTPALAGRIRFGDQDLQHLSRGAVARAVAYVPQSYTGDGALRLADLVLLGRTPHVGLMATPSAADRARAEAALALLDLEDRADIRMADLSGGQRQLGLVARAIAQDCPVVLMDEPTASLDFGNKLRVAAEVRALAARGAAVLLSTHDPQQALDLADAVMLLSRDGGGRVGPPADLITAPELTRLYGVAVRVERTASGDSVVLAPRP
jgi:iron complex transport system ATP-binding protein